MTGIPAEPADDIIDNASTERHPLRRVGWALIGGLLIIALALATLALAIDRGLLNGPITRWASHASGRNLRFGRLSIHLLSRQPGFEIDNMGVGNPPGFSAGDLVWIHRLSARLSPGALWKGSLGIRSLRLDGVALSLIRYGPGRNNWTSAHPKRSGAAFAILAGVGDFQVTNARLRFHDIARNLDVSGPFSIADRPHPFNFAGSGSYLDAPISVSMQGGALNDGSVGRPYPFEGELIDGATRVTVRGTSVAPFDLSAYTLKVSAAGPNLADLGYLFHLITPNTTPYRLGAVVSSGNGILRVGRIDVRTHSSQVTGSIWSDHRDPRRDIHADFHAGTLDRVEIDAMLSPVVPRALARNRSGAVPRGTASRFIISDAPLGLARLRATDLDFDIAIGVLTGYPLPFRDVKMRIDLDHGQLGLPSFRGALFGGLVSGRGRIDARAALPHTTIALRLSGLHLNQMPRGGGQTGSVDGQISMSGAGASFHEAAAHADGSIAVRVSALSLSKAADRMIGGDLLRAGAARLTKTGAASSVSIASGRFTGRNGRFASTTLAADSAAGHAAGNASIDFASEQVCAYLDGRPDHGRLFQVSAPFRIAGPWLNPQLSVLPGAKAHALGLRGKLGIVLTPLASLLPMKAAPSGSCL